jgi:putative transposase
VFEGQVLGEWAYRNTVHLAFIWLGKPIANACIESFNGRFRDECLNEHWFPRIVHALSIIDNWRIAHNTERTQAPIRTESRLTSAALTGRPEKGVRHRL